MPIITPAYPSMNSTYNVSRSTLAVMQDEFARGAEIMLHGDGSSPWPKLLEKSNFLARYKVYVQVTALSGSRDELLLWLLSFSYFTNLC